MKRDYASAVEELAKVHDEGLFDSYDVSADGQRFVLLETVQDRPTTQKLTVIQNWFGQFKDKQK